MGPWDAVWEKWFWYYMPCPITGSFFFSWSYFTWDNDGEEKRNQFYFSILIVSIFSYIWVFTAFSLPGRSCSVLFSLKPHEVEEHVEVSRHKSVSASFQGRLCHGGEFNTAVQWTCVCKKKALPAACTTFHASLRGSGRAQESSLHLFVVRKENFF